MQKQKIEKWNTIENEEAFVSTLLVFHEVDAWYIDFGTSMHLSSCKEWFHDYENIVLYKGDNSIQEAIQKGNMDVTMEIRENIVRGTFINVLHVLGIIRSLFFMSKAISQGHMFEF